jgi:hypothetical protein
VSRGIGEGIKTWTVLVAHYPALTFLNKLNDNSGWAMFRNPKFEKAFKLESRA